MARRLQLVCARVKHVGWRHLCGCRPHLDDGGGVAVLQAAGGHQRVQPPINLRPLPHLARGHTALRLSRQQRQHDPAHDPRSMPVSSTSYHDTRGCSAPCCLTNFEKQSATIAMHTWRVCAAAAAELVQQWPRWGCFPPAQLAPPQCSARRRPGRRHPTALRLTQVAVPWRLPLACWSMPLRRTAQQLRQRHLSHV
jgi:hypothetical protein